MLPRDRQRVRAEHKVGRIILLIGLYLSCLLKRQVKFFCLFAQRFQQSVRMNVNYPATVIVYRSADKELTFYNTAADCRLKLTFVYLRVHQLSVIVAYDIARRIYRNIDFRRIAYFSCFYVYSAPLALNAYPRQLFQLCHSRQLTHLCIKRFHAAPGQKAIVFHNGTYLGIGKSCVPLYVYPPYKL